MHLNQGHKNLLLRKASTAFQLSSQQHMLRAAQLL